MLKRFSHSSSYVVEMVFGFNYFRAFPEDAVQNENYSKTKLTMPILAVGAGYIPAFGGDVTINYALYGMQRLAHLPVLRFLYQDTGYQKSGQTL